MDASVGGLGGCPFAGPGASGNLATEDNDNSDTCSAKVGLVKGG